ncbi:PAS domain S-box protein [Methanoregula sp.]|uniref:hybrid sensor histidine kinase/response regulator n=1 Tax=Methanoregula sp. TaxID=2052170 RepID=UPI003BB04C67
MITVLYVDDEPDLLEIGKLFLESSGDFHVDTETSARAALAALGQARYDAIVSDYLMPDMDGISLLRQVRAQFPGMPFILYTGRGREDVVIEAINNGADSYLQKGGDPDLQFSDLAYKIRQAVRMRMAEQDLADSRDYLNLIFSSVRAGILVTDAATHRILDINPAAADLIGLPRDQILGEEGHRFIRPAGAGRSSIASPGQAVDTSERVLLTADKRSVPVIDYITPVTLSGTPCLLETFIDNTERKQAELDLLNAYGELMKSAQSLRESEEQYRTLSDSANDAIFLARDRRFVRCNKRTPEMFGCRDASEILGHSPEEFSPEFQPDGVRSAEKVAANDRAVLEGTPLAFEWVHTRRDGTPFYTEVSLNAMEIRGKTYVQSIVRDISDRKRAEQAAALAGRKLHMMNEFTRHEITNTITGLIGLVDMDYGMPAGAERDQLNREIKGLILDIQKQVAFTKEYQEIGVREPRWQQVRGMIPVSPRPAIHVSPALDNLEIYADPLVAKIFTYLAENVVRHGGQATRIGIGADQNGPDLKIVFADDGVGVPGGMKSAIFERKIGERKGMGLFMVREILAITGITITETGTPGAGARFEIVVPEGGFRYGKNEETSPAEGAPAPEIPTGTGNRS